MYHFICYVFLYLIKIINRIKYKMSDNSQSTLKHSLSLIQSHSQTDSDDVTVKAELKQRFQHIRRVTRKESHPRMRSYEDFLITSILSEMEDRYSYDEILNMEKCFRIADHDQDGKLNPEELKYWLEKHNRPVTPWELKHILEIADEDQDGHLNFKEFILFCEKIELKEAGHNGNLTIFDCLELEKDGEEECQEVEEVPLHEIREKEYEKRVTKIKKGSGFEIKKFFEDVHHPLQEFKDICKEKLKEYRKSHSISSSRGEQDVHELHGERRTFSKHASTKPEESSHSSGNDRHSADAELEIFRKDRRSSKGTGAGLGMNDRKSCVPGCRPKKVGSSETDRSIVTATTYQSKVEEHHTVESPSKGLNHASLESLKRASYVSKGSSLEGTEIRISVAPDPSKKSLQQIRASSKEIPKEPSIQKIHSKEETQETVTEIEIEHTEKTTSNEEVEKSASEITTDYEGVAYLEDGYYRKSSFGNHHLLQKVSKVPLPESQKGHSSEKKRISSYTPTDDRLKSIEKGSSQKRRSVLESVISQGLKRSSWQESSDEERKHSHKYSVKATRETTEIRKSSAKEEHDNRNSISDDKIENKTEEARKTHVAKSASGPSGETVEERKTSVKEEDANRRSLLETIVHQQGRWKKDPEGEGRTSVWKYEARHSGNGSLQEQDHHKKSSQKEEEKRYRTSLHIEAKRISDPQRKRTSISVSTNTGDDPTRTPPPYNITVARPSSKTNESIKGESVTIANTTITETITTSESGTNTEACEDDQIEIEICEKETQPETEAAKVETEEVVVITTTTVTTTSEDAEEKRRLTLRRYSEAYGVEEGAVGAHHVKHHSIIRPELQDDFENLNLETPHESNASVAVEQET